MTSGGGPAPDLHELLPREQAGAGTGERYEFQYHQAAADALHVLDDTQVACVYCEWHDDYVIESAGVVRYRFHQVKTRSASQGPWKLNEFFGVKRLGGKKPKSGTPKASTATSDSIFGRFYEHFVRFADRCECFVFISDAGTTSDLDDLVEAARSAVDRSALPSNAAGELASLHATLKPAFSSLTPDDLFAFLKRLYFPGALGKLGDLRGFRALIGGRIYELSEVDLKQSEAQKIGADLVAAVRERSHRVFEAPPSTLAELRAAKGLVLDDVLKLLSLSDAGYRALRSGGRDSVVALSRLHRLCKRSGVADALIPELCALKTTWETWFVAQRHALNPLDLLALKKECADALRVHAAGSLDFHGLRAEANTIATKYRSVLTSSDPISEELVFGLIIALAVEAEQ